VNGTIEVTGIGAPVEIVRDANAIPHIFGATRRDTLFGLGYVHAQDRLWQMEFQRRIGFGRLSEIFGAATVSQDRFLRTVGFGRAARSAWERLAADARADVEAYCAGVNEFLGTHRASALPPEFSVLRFEPEPWTGPDVIVWAKMRAWDLSANYGMELLRHDLTARVGAERNGATSAGLPSRWFDHHWDGPARLHAENDRRTRCASASRGRLVSIRAVPVQTVVDGCIRISIGNRRQPPRRLPPRRRFG
jgi:acyl-homoserine lactone acylase PvdQ